jgi:hypothetical protein
MLKMKHLVSHQGAELGPLAIDEIVAKVRAKELDLFDYVFDESKADWVLLMEFPALAEKLKSNKPPRPPKLNSEGQIEAVEAAKATVVKPTEAKVQPTASAHSISEWFVLKGENRFGPFAYTDLVKMLQQKVLFPFDFIWHAGLAGWKRVVELEDFKPETIRLMFANDKVQAELFAERKFERKVYKGRVIVHDNLSLWKGEGFEISRGGVGVEMANSLVVPGQHVFVHFKKHEEWPAFNAVCEVVSKKFVNDATPVQYGLRFLSLSQEVQDEFFKKVA